MPKLNLTRWIMTAEVLQVQAVHLETGINSGQAVELSAGVKKKPHEAAGYRRTHINLFSTFHSAFLRIHCPVAQARCRKCIVAMP